MLDQLGIAIFGVTAIYLSQDLRESRRKWACVFGLIAQPFWFWTSYTHQQWGVFVLCFFYTFSWACGFRNHWIINRRNVWTISIVKLKGIVNSVRKKLR